MPTKEEWVIFIWQWLIPSPHSPGPRYMVPAAAAAAKSRQSCLTLHPRDGSPLALLSLGFSRQESWSVLPFPSPMHESEKWKWSRSVVSDSATPWTGCSLLGSSIHGIFQARVLEWVAMPSPHGSSTGPKMCIRKRMRMLNANSGTWVVNYEMLDMLLDMVLQTEMAASR